MCLCEQYKSYMQMNWGAPQRCVFGVRPCVYVQRLEAPEKRVYSHTYACVYKCCISHCVWRCLHVRASLVVVNMCVFEYLCISIYVYLRVCVCVSE